ncbi:MAG: helix-turn-helix transcriptional regulator [Clostridia bacterium]|nr:helix-turn-helix transcriptional regulator [Clostridia bacterium]
MAQKKVGELIKEARAKKGLSQEKLAGMIEGLSASELSKAERGEKDLTAAELKAIAKICGVTQKSLLEAAGLTTAAKPTASTAKKPSTTAKTSSTTAAKKTSTASSGEKLTAAEKRFLELYRAASSTVRKNAEAVLKGTKKVQEETEADGLVGSLLGGALEALTGLGKK